MEERASRLLAQSDSVLFAHGGCHVFALALREFTGLPLLWVREDDGSYDHVACDGGNQSVVDYFGWFSYLDYVRAESLDGRAIRFKSTEEEEVRRRQTLIHGPGYYAHPEFLIPAFERAHTWISKHHHVFKGDQKIIIPGLRRIQRADENDIYRLFGEKT